MSNAIKTIGEYTITEKDVDEFIATLPREQQMYKDIPEFRQQVVERLEEITLFALLGEEQKVEETEVYQAAMKAAKRDIAGQLAMSNVLKDVEVTDEEAKAYYEEHKSTFAKGPSVTASHILVDSEDKAHEIKSEIEEGKKTFAEAAKEYSSCPSSQKGGSLGSFGKGQMVKEFEQAAFEGEEKTIIGPVQTQFGYHLIWVDEKSEGETPDFEVVADKVKASALHTKQQKIYDEKLEELRKKYVK